LLDDVTGLRKQVADLKQSQLERRRIEDGLRKSEEELRTLLDSAPVGMCLLNSSGEPILANGRMAKLLGYSSPNELVRLGSTIGVIADEAGKNWIRERAGDPASAQASISFKRLDGSVIELSALGERRDGDGSVAVVVTASPLGIQQSDG
jgi:PAS domain S-box-containing protein